MGGHSIDFVLIIVGGQRENRAVLVNGEIWWVVDDTRQTRSITSKQNPLFAIFRLEYLELVVDTYDKTIREGVEGIDALTQWWVKNIGLVFTVISTKDHLSVICANEDHACSLWPSMTGEVRWNLATLLHVVDLWMIMFEDCVILFLPLLHVDKSVAGSRHQDSRRTMINWVEWDLEVADISFYVALAANACLGYEFFPFPVPHEDLPVWLTCQSHDIALILWVEGTSDELLGVKSIYVLDLFRQSLPLFLACDIKDGEFAFVSSWTSLTNSYELLGLWYWDMSDGLSVLWTYR